MRLYRALLHLYPASFRNEYGGEMCAVFRRQRREAAGLPGVAALWLRVSAGICASAALAHWDILRQDLRYTARTLLGARGFALTVILVAGLGIGANTAVFSLTNHVLLRPLPFADSNRLVKLWESLPEYGRTEASPPNFRDWKSMSTSFDGMAAFTGVSANLSRHGDPERLEGTEVTADLLPLLGVQPQLGRTFTAEDERHLETPGLVISHSLWQARFGGEGGVLGAEVALDGVPFTVVGVMPPDFHFPNRDARFWRLFTASPEDLADRDNNYWHVLAKLRDGVTIEQAREEMRLIGARLERAYPNENAQTSVSVYALRDEVSQQTRLLLTALLAAAFLVLLIACVNAANLLLARALSRQKELAVRSSLGAGRERLVRQLMTESLALAALSGVAGVVAAYAVLPLLSRLVPASLPISQAPVIDVRVLAFALLLTGLTGMAFGVIPALRTARAQADGLREGLRAGVGGRRERLRSTLVVVEVMTSIVLLVSAGLLVRALVRLQAVDPGFRAENVLTLRTWLPVPKYDIVSRRVEFYDRVLGEVRALPGVTSAGYTSFLPMTMRGGIWEVEVPGYKAERGASTSVSLRFVTPGFFSALSIPVRLGRDVAESDTADTGFVAVVSASFADRYFPGQDPLGRRIRLAFDERTIVGVVGDVRVRGLERSSEPQVYLPYKQVRDGSLRYYAPKDLVIRAGTDPTALVPALRRIIGRADPEQAISDVRTLDDIVAADTVARRVQLWVLGCFALVAYLLAGIGIYGVLAFTVSRRSQEIGVRMALGAPAGRIFRMVVREGVLLAGAGIALGLPLAYAAGVVFRALLAGVGPGDLATFASAAVLGLTMTVAGSLLPALRAARVDPATTIRNE